MAAMFDVLPVSLLLCAVVSTVVLVLISIIFIAFRLKDAKRKVCIIVLGDIGRSPRMQYHAKSFSEENFQVNIVGFRGSTPIKSLCENDNIQFAYLSQPPKKPPILPGSLFYIFKAIYQWIQLFMVLLFVVEKPMHFLVQNPPSIPTLSVVWIVSWIKGSNFIIDWHNYAYTILAMNIKKKKHILVRFSEWYEGVFGSFAHFNFCVTEAMKNDLAKKWGINANVLYDRPPVRFKKTSIDDKHELFIKLYKEGYSIFSDDSGNSTLFTKQENGEVMQKDGRPAIIISSTSWTEDEDFSILLNALELYDDHQSKTADSLLPNLVCIITGKGPQKEYYIEVLKKKNFASVQVVTPWLTADDYPKLIGSGDLGICLHTSSSGLDLPMKVVDMFGCSLPVCAVNFSCLDELVKHDVNGLVFDTSDELCNQMIDLIKDFPGECKKLYSYQANLASFQQQRWHENWMEVVSVIL